MLKKVLEKSNNKKSPFVLLVFYVFGDSSTNRQKCCAMKSPKTQRKTTGNNDKLIVLCMDDNCVNFCVEGLEGEERTESCGCKASFREASLRVQVQYNVQ